MVRGTGTGMAGPTPAVLRSVVVVPGRSAGSPTPTPEVVERLQDVGMAAQQAGHQHGQQQHDDTQDDGNRQPRWRPPGAGTVTTDRHAPRRVHPLYGRPPPSGGTRAVPVESLARRCRRCEVADTAPARSPERSAGPCDATRRDGMDGPLRIETVTIDATDPTALGRFWSAALGWEQRTDEDGDIWIEPGDDHPDTGGSDRCSSLRVPRGQGGKNRLHLDLVPDDQEREVERLEDARASRARIGQTGNEAWVVLADPEGNEFCVLERA